ncbi:MAG: hypothetical protein R3190_17415, partial [Thermoanaerobaculia bacterium]|nr:hypothetical protein [Thermoanaerobaculia bacterium]
MGPVLVRRIWFAALLMLVPVPIFVFGHELAPTARYAVMLGATLVFAASEGAAGPVPALALLLAAHVLVYGAAALLVARAIARR